MEKTIELVNLWGDFASNHPDASIADFCRHYLTNQREKETQGKLVGGVVPMLVDGLLLKILGRISKLHHGYASAALEGTALNQIEEFGFLGTIQLQKNPKKSEVIFDNLMELSSGTDMLNRLKKKGLIKEVDDKEDKRSKRVSLTPLGEKTFATCISQIHKLAKMMLHDMTDEDKKLCIQLLKNVEIKFSSLAQKHKGKDFDSIYQEMVGDSTETGAISEKSAKRK
jgi:DNA-binding MarR family transcriptional regulator